jgi:hypothetical protein
MNIPSSSYIDSPWPALLLRVLSSDILLVRVLLIIDVITSKQVESAFRKEDIDHTCPYCRHILAYRS